MTIKEKQKLVSLLHTYMDELMEKNDKNQKINRYDNYDQFTVGVKAQYEHARVISSKLAKEINDEMKTY